MTIDNLIQHLIDVVTAYESDGQFAAENFDLRKATSEDVDAARSAIRAEFERMTARIAELEHVIANMQPPPQWR